MLPPLADPDSAAHALSAGGLVVAPTETLFGLFARADLTPPLEAARAARARLRPDSSGPLALHLSSAAALTAFLAPLGTLPALHARLIHRLTPGPVTFRIERVAHHISTLTIAAGLLPGAADNGSSLLVRVPDHPAPRALLSATAVHNFPIVAQGITALDGAPVRSLDAALARLAQVGINADAVFNTEPAPFGTRSTLVRLTAAGGYAIESVGLVSEPTITDRIARRVLFVCTGNTCRSPMAEAIAKGLAEKLVLKVPTVFSSAGASAMNGAPFSPETRRAVEALGLSPPRGASRALTAELLAGADAVFVMTRSHERAVGAIMPESARRVALLDPAGKDVADPIGGSQGLYDQTAKAMADMIAKRLAELEASDG